MRVLVFTALLFLSACATTHETLPSGRKLHSYGEYNEVVQKYTDHDRKYSGLYNTMDVQGTLLTREVLEAQNEQTLRFYQWTEERLNEEIKKSQERLMKQTEVFLSFYTPERKDDNLNKPDTRWQIFLDVDGKRYDGKATKIKQLVSEIQSFYPYYNRLATPYLVTFPVPMNSLDGKKVKVTVSGPIDSAVLSF